MGKNFGVVVCLLGVGLFLCLAGAQISQSKAAGLTDVASAASAYPAEHWKNALLYSPYSAGSHVAIAFDPDHYQDAWVSFYNETDGDLWAAHYIGAVAGNCGPNNSWWCEVVDRVASESKGLYSSIDGHPDTNPDPGLTTWKVGISYYDATHKSLKYAQHRCPVIGDCFWSKYTVHSPVNAGDNFGQYSSLEFDSTGIAHIAYYSILDTGSGNFMYSLTHAHFAGGSTGNCGDDDDWQCEYIDWDASPDPGLYPSLDIDWDDRIYIAYYNGINQRLMLVTDFGGTDNCGQDTYWFCEAIDDPAGANVGLFPSMAAPHDTEDIERIAYYDTTNGSLKIAYPLGGSGGNCGQSDSWQCSVIDSMGAGRTWASISMAVDSLHHAMIAYSRFAGEPIASLSLRVAELAEGQPYANCGGGSWWCGTLDSGSSFADQGKYLALGIKPGGLAMIAYSSWVNNDNAYNLRFAYQEAWIFLPLIRK